MQQPNNAFIEHRTQALAQVFLTRRQDVAVLPFDQDLDLFVTIYPQPGDSLHGFIGFGVILWGTDRPLPTDESATQYANAEWRARTRKAKAKSVYFLPVILLLFSMENDRGYYAWVAEPYVGESEPKLKIADRLGCARLERGSLDEIVLRVKEWYTRLASAILVNQ